VRYETTTDIDAPVEAVWQLTERAQEWPSFVPTMTRVAWLDAGPLRVGRRARIKQPAQPAGVWTVTRLDPPHLLEWETRRPGLTMTASHILDAREEGSRLTLVVVLSGAAARLLAPIAGARILAAIVAENDAFKRRAEGPEAPPPSA
jgi:hypothetical protein